MKKVLVLLCLLLTVGAAAYFAGFTDVQKIKAFFVAEKTADSPVTSSASSQPVLIGTEKRVALVIGNSDYAAADDLPNDVNDANDMVEVLRGYGFQIVSDKALTDVDLTGMLKALDEFGQQLQQGGVGLFYYSGHGLEVDGQQYIVPVDAQISSKTELPYRLVNINTILEKVGESKTQLNLVILDACRNNPFTKALGIKAVGYNGFSKIEKNIPNGTLIASATAMGDTASSACEHNSCYTTQLLKFLKEKPTDEVRLLLGDVTEAVIAATNNEQTPWTSGSMMGRFSFAQGDENEVKRKVKEDIKVEKPVPTTPPETIYYGSRLGMSVNILSKEGIDSENAVIKTKHTFENAIEYCREYEHSAQKKCIDDELSIKINDYISADCKGGNFTDFFGKVYQFQGLKDNHNDPIPLAEYAIYDYKAGEVLDGTSASGYPVYIDLFKALCPSKVSKSSNEEESIPNYSESDRNKILNNGK